MNLRKDSVSLIIVGKWNRYILTPEWIAKHFFNATELAVEFSLNLDSPPRFTRDDIRIVPEDNRIKFEALRYNDDVLLQIEQMSVKLAKLLPVTPVKAFGINFGFVAILLKLSGMHFKSRVISKIIFYKANTSLWYWLFLIGVKS